MLAILLLNFLYLIRVFHRMALFDENVWIKNSRTSGYLKRFICLENVILLFTLII